MTKTEIINHISEKINVNKNLVADTVEEFMNTVKETLEAGDNIYIRGFGTFHVKHRAEKVARDISKGVPIVVPAHSTPAFKPAKNFVDTVKTKIANKTTVNKPAKNKSTTATQASAY